MEIKWTTTISEEDLREWIITKYGSKEEFAKVYREKCREYEKDYEFDIQKTDKFLNNLAIITNIAEREFFKDYLWDMVDDSVVEVSSFKFNEEYNEYLVEYTKEVK